MPLTEVISRAANQEISEIIVEGKKLYDADSKFIKTEENSHLKELF